MKIKKIIRSNLSWIVKQGIKRNKKAFTLVELIIVITILSVLWTIWLVSYQWYTQDARDGNRISTISSISKWLEIFQVTSGTYPEPEWNIISGKVSTEELLRVWEIGSTISSLIKSTHSQDPSTQENYVYGVNYNNKSFQIATSLEKVQSMNILPTTYANFTSTKVVWNYDGLVLKYPMLYNPPSLIFTGTGDLVQSSTGFIVNKWSNLLYGENNSQTFIELYPLVWSTATTLTGILIGENNYHTFTWVLWYNEDVIGVKVFWEKKYYSQIKINTNEGNQTPETPPVSNSCSSSLPTCNGISCTLTYNPTSVNQSWVKDVTSCWYACTGWYTWTDCNIAPVVTCSLPDIHIWTQRWQACNVWASTSFEWDPFALFSSDVSVIQNNSNTVWYLYTYSQISNVCPTWYRLPTRSDWNYAVNETRIFNWEDNLYWRVAEILKLPNLWWIDTVWWLWNLNTWVYHTSETQSENTSYIFLYGNQRWSDYILDSSQPYGFANFDMAYKMPVRCIKN